MKKSHFSPKITLICLTCFLVAFFISNRLFRGDPAGWKQIVTSDGRGYYAYLPALLIDQDPTCARVIERERTILGFPGYQPGYLVKYGDRTVNKYFAGEAVLLLPFFITAVLFTLVFGGEMTGYSFFFQALAGIGALFYLVAGLFFLARILKHLGVRDTVVSFVVIAILLGTNLFYYSVWQPTMSHLYSFFAINGLIWLFIRLSNDFSKRNSLLTGLLFGIVILIRPTNAVVLLLAPFFVGSTIKMKEIAGGLAGRIPALLILLIAAGMVVVIQPALWYLQTGKFFIWSYTGEGFNFGNPAVRSVLLSFRKGLFIYTPLLILALAGMIPLLKKPVMLISMLLFLIVSTWIIASWWNWYYGDGFGLRAFIDYYGIFAILIALFLNSVTLPREKLVLTLLFTPFIFLNLFQTWQYCNNIIHPYSMNPVKYKYVFMKSDSVYMNCLGGNQELPGCMVDMNKPVLSTIHTFDTVVQVWNYAETRNISNAYSGKFVNILDSLHIYSSGYMTSVAGISPLPVKYYVVASLMVYDSIPGASNGANLVFSMDSINFRENYYQRIRLNDIPDNPARTWRKCLFSLTLPQIRNPEGILKIYVWNTGRKTFLIDDFRIDLYRDPSGDE